MYSLLIAVTLWVTRFSMLFSLSSSTIKANIKENKEKLPKPLKIMWFHLLCAGFLQVIMIILSQLHRNNMLLVHMYIVEEFVFDMLFYREIVRKPDYDNISPTKRPIFITAIVAFVAFAVINAAFITDTNHFPIYSFAIQSIITVVCAIKYFFDRNLDGEDPISHAEFDNFRIYKAPVFYINMGKLIYFLFACPLFLLYALAMENKEEHTAILLAIAEHFLLIILHIFMGIGFLKFINNPLKVPDFFNRDRKRANMQIRKQFVNDPDFAKKFRNSPDFEDFKIDNPDLFD